MSAAFAHALWNLLLARTRDPQLATAVALPVSLLVSAPIALVTGHISAAAVPFIAVSGLLELVYFALLAFAYGKAGLSTVYPLARGSAPVFVLLLSGARSPLQVSGIVLVGLGSLLVRGFSTPASWRDVGLSLIIGATIAGYTLVDQHGVAFADPVAYLEAVLLLPALVYCAFTVRVRSLAVVARAVQPTTVMAGMLMFAAYALVLAALQLASASAVAAARETSVVIAVALSRSLLDESVPRARLLGAALVTAGVAVVVLG
jgi:uncharacterized membrane protein